MFKMWKKKKKKVKHILTLDIFLKLRMKHFLMDDYHDVIQFLVITAVYFLKHPDILDTK